MLPAIVSIFLFLLNGTQSEPAWLIDMRYCDIVVHGTIKSVSVELKPENEATPMLHGSRPDVSVKVAMIQMDVQEVLRGNVPVGSLDFVAFVGMSIFKGNYAVGQEIVVGLTWGADVLGGSYWLHSDNARLIRGSKDWVEQGDGSVFADLSPIKDCLADIAPTRVLQESEIAITGEVRGVTIRTIKNTDGREGVLMSIDLSGVEALTGQAIPSDITVKQITSGDYWPAWRDPAPLRDVPTAGARYCFFLKSVDGGYAIVRGINGVYEARGDRLYFAGRTPINLTTRQVKDVWEKR